MVKTNRLINHFVSLFVCLFCFFRSPKRLVSFLYSSVNVIVSFVLSFTFLAIFHFIILFSLPDFMSVPNEQSVFITPERDSSLPKFVSGSLELC